MKQSVVLSGKGGTGRTTVAAALAHVASQESSVVLADADVDTANLELVLDPTKREEHDFWRVWKRVRERLFAGRRGIPAGIGRRYL